jgi:hypothetical protein
LRGHSRILQESAFRAATERFATLSETSQTLAKQKVEAIESGKAALDALAAAHSQAAEASRQLASIEAQLSRTSAGFDGTAPLSTSLTSRKYMSGFLLVRLIWVNTAVRYCCLWCVHSGCPCVIASQGADSTCSTFLRHFHS